MRRQSRELALQILFQTEFAPQIEYSLFLEIFEKNFDSETIDFADQLIKGVQAYKAEIDPIIQSCSQRWTLTRMALVDLTILRMSVFEIKFMSPPNKPQIVINEAVELAKQYGTTDSASFVNGLLDQIAKEI